MASQEGQALLVPFATATLQSLWSKRPSLAGLHAQLHCNQQEMSVCFWLLQLTTQLPAADLRTFVIKSRDDAITAVADTLAISLMDTLNQQPTEEIFKALKRWQETVYAAIPHFSARQSHGYRKALLMASHCISCAEPTHISSLQQLLRTVVNECNSSTSQPGSYMVRLSEQASGLDFDITPALLAIIGDVVQQFCCMQQPSPLQIQELRSALQLAFSPALKAPSVWQDHQIAQLLDEARPKQLLQAVWCQIEDTLTGLVQEPLPTLLTLPEPLQAELVYVPPFMRNRYILVGQCLFSV